MRVESYRQYTGAVRLDLRKVSHRGNAAHTAETGYIIGSWEKGSIGLAFDIGNNTRRNGASPVGG